MIKVNIIFKYTQQTHLVVYFYKIIIEEKYELKTLSYINYTNNYKVNKKLNEKYEKIKIKMYFVFLF